LWSELLAPLVNMIKDGCKKMHFFNPFNLSFKKLINLTSTKKN